MFLKRAHFVVYSNDIYIYLYYINLHNIPQTVIKPSLLLLLLLYHIKRNKTISGYAKSETFSISSTKLFLKNLTFEKSVIIAHLEY